MTNYGKRAQKIFQHPILKTGHQAGLTLTNEEKRERGRPLSQEIENRVAHALLKHEQGATIRTISKDAHVKWETAATWLEVLRLRGMARMVSYGNLRVYIPIDARTTDDSETIVPQ